MPEATKQVLKSRTETHSDVADTPAAREHQSGMTERQFADSLVRRVREAKGPLVLRNFREEWLNADDGLVHELSVEVESPESAS
jgi:hypothetical protein